MSVVFQQYIYVLGGRSLAGKVSKTVFVCDPNSDNWNTLGEMPTCCEYTSAVVLQNKIYVVGGFNRRCLSFDPILNQWTSLSSCEQEHVAGSALVWKGRILVCGGRKRIENSKDSTSQEDTSLIEQYDPEKDTWVVFHNKLARKMAFPSIHLVHRAWSCMLKCPVAMDHGTSVDVKHVKRSPSEVCRAYHRCPLYIHGILVLVCSIELQFAVLNAL